MSEPRYEITRAVSYGWTTPEGKMLWDVYYTNFAGETRSVYVKGSDELDAYKNALKKITAFERRALRRKEEKHENGSRGA